MEVIASADHDSLYSLERKTFDALLIVLIYATADKLIEEKFLRQAHTCIHELMFAKRQVLHSASQSWPSFDIFSRFILLAMKKTFQVALTLLALLMSVAIARVPQAPDPRIADLVRAGKLRVALFLPQYTKDPATGELRGSGPGVLNIEIARALAARLGVEMVLAGYPTTSDAIECLKTAACDVAFMGIDPSRAALVSFSPPMSELDYTYLVPAGSLIRSMADVDRPGVRIAVVRNHASTLDLNRMLKHAEQVAAETPDAAFELVRTGRAETLASTRPALVEYSAKLPGSRVLEDRYGANITGIVIAKGQAGRLAYISEFIEGVKASGFVEKAIERSGLAGVKVAPRGAPRP